MLSIKYRTDGAWGTGLGRNLTAPEIDGNFYALEQAVDDLIASPVQPRQIASITVAGTDLTFHLDDGSAIGPVPIPVVFWTWRGDYQPTTQYFRLDWLNVPLVGIFLVLVDHVSAATFDPAAEDGSGNPLYVQIADSAAGGIAALADVELTGLLDGQVLQWNATDAKWKNVTLGSLAFQDANAVDITGGTITGLPAPTNPADAVTKAYADGLALGAPAIADGDLLANISGASAAPLGVTLSAFLDHVLATTARGSLIFRGAAGWIALAPGTIGQLLRSGGAGADLSWTDPIAGGVTRIAAGVGISTGGVDITSTGNIGLAPIAAATLLANLTAGSAAPTPQTLSAIFDALVGATRGTVAYRGATGWVGLPPGSAGKYLKTLGPTGDPMWDSPAGAGTVTEIDTGAGLTGGPINSTGLIALDAIADGTFLANISGASAAPVSTTLSLYLDHVLSSAQGSILVRTGTDWAALAPGTNGQVLTTGGAAANAAWQNAPSGGPISNQFLLANLSGASATPTGHSLSDILDAIVSSSRGTLLFRGASGWTGLAPGTSGFVLTSGGPTGDPHWAAGGGGGGGSSTLAGDTDVSIASPANDDFLTYDSGSGLWTNRTHASATARLDAFTGDAGSGGIKGLVPAPATGDAAKFLKGDGTWGTPSGGSSSLASDTDVTIASPADKDFLIYDSASSKWVNRTHAQATADLDPLVGDTGSGGTQGLVPAPGAGDAAAGKMLKADGTWATPSGGGLFSGIISSVPTLTNTGFGATPTWLNQGTRSVAAGSKSGLYFRDSGTANTFVSVISKAAPATPYVIDMLVARAQLGINGHGGICAGFSDGTKFHLAALQTSNGSPNIEVRGWTTSGATSSQNYTASAAMLASYIWIRVRDDGANFYLQFSFDGENFEDGFHAAKSGGFLGASGYTNVVVGLCNSEGLNGQAAGTLLGWYQH